MKTKVVFAGLAVTLSLMATVSYGQNATAKESEKEMTTYPFSDPDPVASPRDGVYPYWHFSGFTTHSEKKKWKTVTLENQWIKVVAFPEIGGKVWSAIDKTTNRAFLYDNGVVKFRDIAMRGPWVSGGIEFNFGILGHVPTSSTPMDYYYRVNPDGSASYFTSAFEFLTHTLWQVEVRLPKDKAYFITKVTWFNGSGRDEPYYQWMNSAYTSSDGMQFTFPGTMAIGHSGKVIDYPIDKEGRDISWYKNNNFGGSKSNHVVGNYTHYYGAYWHDQNFGSIHHSDYDAKVGQKIFLWSLARDGEIWKDLLTDNSGQYVELQSGRMYNQPVGSSSYTPFKIEAFPAGRTDSWSEYWYPVENIGGIVEANSIGALNVERKDGSFIMNLSPVKELNTTIKVYASDKEVYSGDLKAEVLKPWTKTIPLTDQMSKGNVKIVVGENEMVYSEKPEDNVINRPKVIPSDFDWKSLYGLYTDGEQQLNQRGYGEAEGLLKQALAIDKYFAPALVRLASLYIYNASYDKALEMASRALSLNAYDAEANYYYGMANQGLSHFTDAKDGFSIASRDPRFRSDAYAELSGLSIRDKDWAKAAEYAHRSLDANNKNFTAWQHLLQSERNLGQKDLAGRQVDSLIYEYPLFHQLRYERYALNPSEAARKDFMSLIRCEQIAETYQEVAEQYIHTGSYTEAKDLLTMANTPMSIYLKAWLTHLEGDEASAKALIAQADKMDVAFVFPSRIADIPALEWVRTVTSSWKPTYFQATITETIYGKGSAADLLNKLTDVDYAPFYLYRARMRGGEGRLQDLLQADKLGRSWRTGKALTNYYRDYGTMAQAQASAEKFLKIYPNNDILKLQYTDILNQSGKYDECLKRLQNVMVLPNEGFAGGEEIYHSAHLNRAIQCILKGNNKAAKADIQATYVYPENLGSGKPYDTAIKDSTQKTLLDIMTNPKAKATEMLKSSSNKVIQGYFSQQARLEKERKSAKK